MIKVRTKPKAYTTQEIESDKIEMLMYPDAVMLTPFYVQIGNHLCVLIGYFSSNLIGRFRDSASLTKTMLSFFERRDMQADFTVNETRASAIRKRTVSGIIPFTFMVNLLRSWLIHSQFMFTTFTVTSSRSLVSSPDHTLYASSGACVEGVVWGRDYDYSKFHMMICTSIVS